MTCIYVSHSCMYIPSRIQCLKEVWHRSILAMSVHGPRSGVWERGWSHRHQARHWQVDEAGVDKSLAVGPLQAAMSSDSSSLIDARKGLRAL